MEFTHNGKTRQTTTLQTGPLVRLFLNPGTAEVLDHFVLEHDFDYSADEIQEITGLSKAVLHKTLGNLRDEKILIENNDGKFQINKESERARCLGLYKDATIDENLDNMAKNQTKK